MSNPFLIFGHRGSPRRFAENTLASFEEALRAGADGFETDLRLLSDQVPVLYHDDEMGADEIESLSSTDVLARGYSIERVRELASFAGRCTMILEVKRSQWEELLVEQLAGWPDIVVASFDHRAIRRLSERQVPFALGVTTFGYLVDLVSYVAGLGATWCFPSFRYVDRDMVTSLHERGIKVIPWTANRERDWQRLRDLGCDGVITDVPAEAVEWRERIGIEN